MARVAEIKVPSSEDFERGLLRNILMDPAATLAIAEPIVKPADFYPPRGPRVKIYKAMLALHAHHKAIDILTVAAEVKRVHEDEELTASISEIAGDAALLSHTDFYAKQIRDKSEQRKLLRLMDAIAEDMSMNDSTVSALVPRLQSALAKFELNGDYLDGEEIALVRADHIQPEALSWMYPERILFRHLNLFVGPPDVGKDSVIVDLIARATTGSEYPDRDNLEVPFDVIMLASEEGLADTLVPRLMVAGADRSRVHFVRGVTVKKEANVHVRKIAFDTDMDKIKRKFREHPTARLLVVSPLGSYLGKLKKNSDDDVRPVLDALRELAEELGIAVLAIMHFNKQVEQLAIDRVGGAGSFVQVPRCVWSFSKDDEDESGESRLMLSVKSNNVKEASKVGLRYRFQEEFLSINGKSEGYPKIEWLGPSTRKVDDVLHQQTDRDESKVPSCVAWLKEFLANGPRPAAEVFAAAQDKGFSPATVRRAKYRAGVLSDQLYFGEGKRGWSWSLPTSDAQP